MLGDFALAGSLWILDSPRYPRVALLAICCPLSLITCCPCPRSYGHWLLVLRRRLVATSVESMSACACWVKPLQAPASLRSSNVYPMSM